MSDSSDLIERVARAIQTADGSPGHNTDGCWNCGVEARAAIRAVAEWLITNGYNLNSATGSEVVDRLLSKLQPKTPENIGETQ